MGKTDKKLLIEVSVPWPGRAEQVVLDHVLPVLCAGGACSFTPDSLLVTPSRRRAAAGMDTLIAASGAGVFGRPVLTLDEFIEALFRRGGGQGVVLSQAARLAIIQAAINEKADSLRYISGPERFPGLVRKFAGLFSEFKQNNIFTASELDKRFRKAYASGLAQVKAGDIITLFDAYLARLLPERNEMGARLLDGEDVLADVASALENRGLPALMPEVRRLVLDGFYDFNPLQASVVRHAIATAPEVVCTLEMETDGVSKWRSERVFALPHRTLEFYRNCVKSADVVFKPAPDAEKLSPASAAGTRLFENLALLPDSKPDTPGVAVLAPGDPLEEVVEIARRIKRFAFEEDSADLSRIAVVFPALADYMPLIREVFPSYGLPFNLSAGSSLASSPVTAAIISAVEAAHDGFRRQTVFRFLSSPFVQAGGGAPLPHEVDIYAREASIAGGSGASEWAHAFNSLRERTLKSKEYAECDDERCLAADDKAASIARAAAFIAGVFEKLSVLAPDKKVTPSEFEGALLKTIGDFGIRSATCDGGGLRAEDIRRNVAAMRSFENTLAGFRTGLELAGGKDTRYAFRDIFSMFRPELFEAQYKHGRGRGGVQVMGLLETRGLSFDYVFLGGMTDDAFPRRREPDFLLTPEERRASGMESIRADVTEDRLLFYKLFMTTKRRLFISWPVWRGERETVPSAFADELKRHLPLAEKQRESDPARLATEPLMSADGSFAYCAADCEEAFASAAAADIPSPRAASAAATLPDEKFAAIARSASVESARRRGGGEFPEYTGRLSQQYHIERVRAMYLRGGNSVSVTGLESYAACPFSFLFSAVLGIEPMEEVEEEMTALDRGSLLHGILEEFYRGRYSRETSRPSPVANDGESIEKAGKQIYVIAQQQLKEFRFEGALWDSFRDSLLAGLPGYLPSSPGTPPGLLLRFIEHEASDPDWCKPRYF